jgi:hypothetical protein
MANPRRSRLVLATVVLLLGGASVAAATTLATPPLHPDLDGRLVCTVVNVMGRRIEFRAQVVSTKGDNVTDFVATDWLDDAATILRTLTAESNADDASYCVVTVTRGGKAGLRASLESFDAAGNRTAVVEAR